MDLVYYFEQPNSRETVYGRRLIEHNTNANRTYAYKLYIGEH